MNSDSPNTADIGATNLYLDVPECFVVFNDDPALPFDPIGASDLTPVITSGEEARASAVWSSFCRWYFVIERHGIYLLNIDGTGWLCRKRSAEFIRLFVEAPKRSEVRAALKDHRKVQAHD